MATVGELSAPYTNFMLNPLPPTAADVCGVCMTFTQGYSTCYRCGFTSRFADAVLAHLLIDDTWTTGANVQSAAAALKTAGADRVGALVIGRHVHDDYQDHAERLKALRRPFDWDICALHGCAFAVIRRSTRDSAAEPPLLR